MSIAIKWLPFETLGLFSTNSSENTGEGRDAFMRNLRDVLAQLYANPNAQVLGNL
jgi:hypothetical protein